jgi:hypothetical protein
MNRRGFLGTLIGGVAAATAVRTFPFRVFSFPTEPMLAATSVRFVKMYDVIERKMINRFDVLYGFGALDMLRHTVSCHMITGINGMTIDQDAIDNFKAAMALDYGQGIIAVPAPALMKSFGSKQIHAGWDVE